MSSAPPDPAHFGWGGHRRRRRCCGAVGQPQTLRPVLRLKQGRLWETEHREDSGWVVRRLNPRGIPRPFRVIKNVVNRSAHVRTGVISADWEKPTRSCHMGRQVVTHLTKVWVFASFHLHMLLPLLLSLGAAGVHFWSHVLYHLCRDGSSGLNYDLYTQWVLGAPPHPGVLQDFADVDGGLIILSEVLLLLEQKALPAVPAQLWSHKWTEKPESVRTPRTPLNPSYSFDWSLISIICVSFLKTTLFRIFSEMPNQEPKHKPIF